MNVCSSMSEVQFLRNARTTSKEHLRDCAFHQGSLVPLAAVYLTRDGPGVARLLAMAGMSRRKGARRMVCQPTSAVRPTSSFHEELVHGLPRTIGALGELGGHARSSSRTGT